MKLNIEDIQGDLLMSYYELQKNGLMKRKVMPIDFLSVSMAISSMAARWTEIEHLSTVLWSRGIHNYYYSSIFCNNGSIVIYKSTFGMGNEEIKDFHREIVFMAHIKQYK